MITHINYYMAKGTDPYENLAVEKYLTMHTQPGQCVLYLWQNEKTVVIGKNQNAWKECKNELLEEDGGHLARRLSGGGAVFHDMGNLNFTFCVRKADYDVARQLGVIVAAVGRLGIRAEISGRNDVTVEGRKISGNAFYRCGDFCYHHGTILIDVDKQQMGRYLNVSPQKLKSKGVDSVKARVVNLSECTTVPVTVSQVRAEMLDAFSQYYGMEALPFVWPEAAQSEILRDADDYASWEWKYGQKIAFDHEMSRRFAWGNVDLQLRVDSGRITAVNLYSDAMAQAFIETLKGRLCHQPYDCRTLVRLVSELHGETDEPMPGLCTDGLIDQMKADICALLAWEMRQ